MLVSKVYRVGDVWMVSAWRNGFVCFHESPGLCRCDVIVGDMGAFCRMFTDIQEPNMVLLRNFIRLSRL